MYNKVKNIMSSNCSIHKHFLESATSVNKTAHDTILNGGTHESLVTGIWKAWVATRNETCL